MRYLILQFLVVISTFGWSHEIRPAYLQLTETDKNQFEVYWRIPSRGNSVPKLEVIFPSGTIVAGDLQPQFVDGFANFSYQINNNESITGKQLQIEGLKKTLIDVLVRLEYKTGEQVTFLLQPDNDRMVIPGETSTFEVIKLYFVLGIEHILFGFDHLLFVLALIILAKDKWKIIKTVTAFTVAHSITLSSASLGMLNIPGAPVEAVIALSIVFLAVEIIQIEKEKPTLTSRKPWLVAFSFGLLHGFGFAGALADIGLPQQAIPWALAFFNVGVEAGQLAFVFVILGATFGFQKLNIRIPKGKQILAYGIGSMASFWMIERVIGFF
jgi:hydrogenase/urease accessory protein HupE